MSIVLGIDPWTTTTWFCILEDTSKGKKLIEYWIIETTPKESLEIKLLDIIDDLQELISKYNPECVWIERLYFTNNQKTALDVAHARWAMIHLFAKKWLKIYEYTPLQVKRWICGNWSASKTQVQNALKFIFKLECIPKPDDAADAMAIAYITSLNKNLPLKCK